METVGYSRRYEEMRFKSVEVRAALPRCDRERARKYNGWDTKYARGRDVTGGSTRTQYPSRRPITQALVTMRF